MKLLEEATTRATWSGTVPYMVPIIRHPLVTRLVPAIRNQQAAFVSLAIFANKCVAARLDRGSGDRKDMLTYMLESHQKRPRS